MTVVMMVVAHYRTWHQTGGGSRPVSLARQVAVPEPYQAHEPTHVYVHTGGLTGRIDSLYEVGPFGLGAFSEGWR